MARPTKPGLDYMMLDCHLDDKFRLIEAEFGIAAFAIVVKLYQRIYGELGYYCEWNEEVALLFSRECGMGGNAVSEIVSASIRRGLFDKRMYDEYGILTSSGIQKRYFDAVSRRKNISVRTEYLLIDVDIYRVNVNRNPVNANRNSKNDDNNPQSRVENNILYNVPPKNRNSPSDSDTLTDYLAQNLWRMSPGNFEDLREFMEDGVSQDLVRHAVDLATAQGKPSWGYVKSILNNWIVNGIRTVGDAKAAHARYASKNQRASKSTDAPPALPVVDKSTGFRDFYK